VLHNAFRVPSKDEAKFVVLLGLVRERQQVPHLREKYHSVAAAEQALSNVKTFWRQYTETSVLVQTPEPEIDRLVNIWIKYQHRASMLQNLNTGRTGSGIWSPAYPCGMGRDSDIRETANVPCDNEIVKENLFDFLEGGPLLLKSDLTPKWGSPTIFKSDLEMRWTATPLPYPSDGRSLWPYSVCWHVRETGDFSVLETAIPYRGQHRWAPASGSGTLFEAMKLAIEDALSGLSARGLPRMNPGLGDWNDGLNLLSRTGKAESVMTAMELCFMLRECAELAQAYNRAGEASAWMQQYASIKAAINQHAWDGRWYVRAFNDEGEPIGSSRNRDGRIFLEPQAWAVLSGVATPERAAMCLESVDELLMTDYGPRLLVPPYSQPDDHVGIIADYGPGWRENGAIWNRPTGWAVMANCLADRAAAAYEMYRRASIHHPSRNENIDRFWLPPYAYPEFLVGAGPEFGRGQFQWCIGKAGTMWRAYVYYILGVRPVFAGLLVDPKIPNEWPGFKLRRTFRGATYAIEVANPKGVNFGVQSMEVDGKPIEGNVVPAYADGKTHEVNVVLGA
jgi:cellobiose phosphorylase